MTTTSNTKRARYFFKVSEFAPRMREGAFEAEPHISADPCRGVDADPGRRGLASAKVVWNLFARTFRDFRKRQILQSKGATLVIRNKAALTGIYD
jgi:hypothetical protein